MKLHSLVGSGVYVRAKTADGRWTAVAVEYLDELSFRVFVLKAMKHKELVFGFNEAFLKDHEYKTELTYKEVKEIDAWEENE